jgi:3,4-dihydroxy 2-butanone 4-phosphate synthase/GTP cyclohydrolase II
VRPHPENVRYLRTKRDRMGHLIDALDDVDLAEGF